eukprot:1716805-Heterocapsa_arctica.AAC.1
MLTLLASQRAGPAEPDALASLPAVMLHAIDRGGEAARSRGSLASYARRCRMTAPGPRPALERLAAA